LSQISALKCRVEVIQGQSFYAHWKAINYFMSPCSYFSLSSKRSEVICAVFLSWK